jgi:hypothetical protein
VIAELSRGKNRNEPQIKGACGSQMHADQRESAVSSGVYQRLDLPGSITLGLRRALLN